MRSRIRNQRGAKKKVSFCPLERAVCSIEIFCSLRNPFTELFHDVITVTGPVEADPEYQLIVEANNLAVEIDNEISRSCF